MTVKNYDKIEYIKQVGTDHEFEVNGQTIKAKFSKVKVTHKFKAGDIGYGIFNQTGDINWLNEYMTETEFLEKLDDVMLDEFNKNEEEKQKTLGDTFKEQPIINEEDNKGDSVVYKPEVKFEEPKVEVKPEEPKKEINIRRKLRYLQFNLSVPKEKMNSFAKFNYRSCGDILAKLKPLLKKVGACVTLNDEIVMIGDRYYVKATARLTDLKTDEFIETSAYAREDLEKKGMDLGQLSGAISSYGRKYALAGLFAIDDEKDLDSMDNSKK